MADKEINDLTDGGAAAAGDLVHVVRSGNSRKATIGAQLPTSPASSSGPASMEFAEDTDNGSHKVTLSAPASLAADVAVVLPSTAGTVALVAQVDAVVDNLDETQINQDYLGLLQSAQLAAPIYGARGWWDAFGSATGIDGTASTFESYNAAGDYYEPTSSGGDTWNNSNKSSGVTLSGGDLTFTSIAGGGYVSGVKSTDAGIGTGKWYFEYTVGVVGTTYLGISDTSSINGLSTNAGYNEGYLYANSGSKVILTSVTAYGNSFTNGDVIGVAFDGDNDKIWFSKNGAWQASGDPAAGTNAASTTVTGSKIPYVGGTGSASGTVNFGDAAFVYTPPTGFSAWGPGTRDNMTLISNEFDAPANAGMTAAFLDIEFASSLTPGTDFDFAMTSAATPSYTSTGVSYTLWYSSGSIKRYVVTGIDLTSQADDAVRARFRTLTNNAIRLTGWRPRWSDA